MFQIGIAGVAVHNINDAYVTTYIYFLIGMRSDAYNTIYVSHRYCKCCIFNFS